MRERVELLKGSLEFLTPPDRGTLVRVRVPLTAPATTTI
jgi:signal transduction histidine kinase